MAANIRLRGDFGLARKGQHAPHEVGAALDGGDDAGGQNLFARSMG